MLGWFELSKSSDGQFRFVLKTESGDTLLTSELYKAKSSAENGIASVQANCGSTERYEEKTATNGKLYFNLKAGNGQVIGSSQMYPNAAARAADIAAVKANGTTTAIKDKTVT